MREKLDKKPLGELESEISAVIGEAIGRPMNPTVDNLEALNIDSLTKLEIMTLLEKRFSLSLTEDEAAQFTSISRIARIIHRTAEAHTTGN